MLCPSCGSYNTIKNGKSSSGEQRYKCKICGRSYTASSSSGSTHKKTVSANQSAPAQNENGIYKILPSIIMITISFIILLFDSSTGWWLMGISLVVGTFCLFKYRAQKRQEEEAKKVEETKKQQQPKQVKPMKKQAKKQNKKERKEKTEKKKM